MKSRNSRVNESFPPVGELREWTAGSKRQGVFMIVQVDGYRVDVVMNDGHREGFLRPYLMSNSYAISED